MISLMPAWRYHSLTQQVPILIIVGFLGVLSARGQSSTTKLKVAAVQFRSSLDLNDNCRRMIKCLDQFSAQGVQVAVFPEFALTGEYIDHVIPASEDEIAAAEDRVRQTCRNRKIAAVFGSIYKINGHAYDTAVVFNASGKLIERYGKIYLSDEKKWAAPGNHIAYFNLDGIPSTVIVCHDERFPELVRLPAIKGARIVYYISAESAVRYKSKLAPYRAQAMAIAVENGMFVVGANAPATVSHGQSRIIAPDGNIIKEAPIYGEHVLISTLNISSKRSEWPLASLNSPLGNWWREGIEWMMKNRNRKLD